MAHWKYLPIIVTINKGLLNKKMSLSIIVVLRQNFLNTFIKIAILGKIYLCSNCYAKLEQHWIQCVCPQQPSVVPILRSNCYIDKFFILLFFNLESRILKFESWISSQIVFNSSLFTRYLLYKHGGILQTPYHFLKKLSLDIAIQTSMLFIVTVFNFISPRITI